MQLNGLIDDLAAEAGALEAVLGSISDEQWRTPTPAQGWDVRDSIAHVAIGNDLALECVTERRSPKVMRDGLEAVLGGDASATAFERKLVDRGRQKSSADVHSWWRDGNSTLCAALRGVDTGQKLPWGPNMMSAASFTTARIMETWAHGLDCLDALGVAPVDTDRLRHIAHLGLRGLPYAFMINGAEAPGSVRLELTSPSGDVWRLGPDDAPTTISGTASDWCRVATHRDRRDERERLRGLGPDADDVLRYVQAYL